MPEQFAGGRRYFDAHKHELWEEFSGSEEEVVLAETGRCARPVCFPDLRKYAEKVPSCMGSPASSGCFARRCSLCMTAFLCSCLSWLGVLDALDGRAIHIALSSRAKPAARRAQAKDHEDMEVFHVVQDSFAKPPTVCRKSSKPHGFVSILGMLRSPSLALHDRSSDLSLSPGQVPHSMQKKF